MKKMISMLLVLAILASAADCWAEMPAVPNEGVPVLMYHSISSKYDSSFCVPAAQFEREMRYLREHNYHSISPAELHAALTEGTPLPENPVLISFDDGFGDNYKTAWPILKKYGFRATFFIVAGHVGNYSIDWPQLQELVNAGNTIGSHTISHGDLTTLTAAQQAKEICQSKKMLEDQLDVPVTAFCIPYGRYNKTTLSLLREAGYEISFTTNPGWVHEGDNLYTLCRLHMVGGTDLTQFAEKLSACGKVSEKDCEFPPETL
ncbi:MAG: polysaccharide deacetylase family protein [Oscillospiraceae bacterium]|jgi:peptidoglycan/xylan/chitin deacetylase (PgdA/CDA1 family)